MVQEVYKIIVTHYMQDENGEKYELEEPIACQYICDRAYGGSGVILNRMFDETKAFALRRAKNDL